MSSFLAALSNFPRNLCIHLVIDHIEADISGQKIVKQTILENINPRVNGKMEKIEYRVYTHKFIQKIQNVDRPLLYNFEASFMAQYQLFIQNILYWTNFYFLRFFVAECWRKIIS